MLNILWVAVHDAPERAQVLHAAGGLNVVLALCDARALRSVREPACGIIGDLAHSSVELRTAMALTEVEGRDPIARVVAVCAEGWSCLQVLRQACWALAELCCDHPGNIARCVEEGGIALLAGLCLCHEDPCVLEEACACLARLATVATVKPLLLEHKLVDGLVRGLVAPSPTLARIQAAAGAIANLAHDFQAGALHCVRSLGPLIEVLMELTADEQAAQGDEYGQVVEQINRALMNLSVDPECAATIAKSTCPRCLLQLVEESPHEAVRVSAAGVLVNLSAHTEAHAVIGAPSHVQLRLLGEKL